MLINCNFFLSQDFERQEALALENDEVLIDFFLQYSFLNKNDDQKKYRTVSITLFLYCLFFLFPYTNRPRRQKDDNGGKTRSGQQRYTHTKKTIKKEEENMWEFEAFN